MHVFQDPDWITRLVKDTDADVVCLQETLLRDIHTALALELQRVGLLEFSCYWHCSSQGCHSGTAILCRCDLQSIVQICCGTMSTNWDYVNQLGPLNYMLTCSITACHAKYAKNVPGKPADVHADFQGCCYSKLTNAIAFLKACTGLNLCGEASTVHTRWSSQAY